MNKLSTQTDILIIGAGFVGLALAVALKSAQPAWRVKVAANRTPNLQPDGRAFALTPGSQVFLENIGVWSHIKSKTQPILKMDISDSRLEDGARPPQLVFDAESPDHPLAYMLESHVLLQGLWEKAQEEQQIEFMRDHSLIDLVNRPHQVDVTFQNEQFHSAKLVAIADGANSSSREKLGIPLLGHNYEKTAIVATLKHAAPHNGTAWQHFLPSGTFALLPLQNNRSSIVWVEDHATASALMQQDKLSFIRELILRAGHALGSFDLETERYAFPLKRQIARQTVKGRCIVLGDAAHTIHPLSGHGLNLGLQDAALLAQNIKASSDLGLDIGNPLMLEEVESIRRREVVSTVLMTEALHYLFSNDNKALRFLRDLGLGVVDKTPALKRALVSAAR